MHRGTAHKVPFSPLRPRRSSIHVIQTGAFDPRCGPVEIPRLFAIELQEGAAIFQDLAGGRYLTEEIRPAKFDAAIAADMKFPAAINCNHAEILDRGFSTITWASGYGEFHLMRMPGAPCHSFQRNTHRCRILSTKAAPFRSDTGFYCTQRFAISVAGNHPRRIQISPDVGELLFRNAQHVDTLPAGNLHSRNSVFINNICNRAKFSCSCDAAPHPWDNRESSILLNIGVRALVDETRLRIVPIFRRPSAQKIKIERRPAR